MKSVTADAVVRARRKGAITLRNHDETPLAALGPIHCTPEQLLGDRFPG
jgi:hypothetical protein